MALLTGTTEFVATAKNRNSLWKWDATSSSVHRMLPQVGIDLAEVDA